MSLHIVNGIGVVLICIGVILFAILGMKSLIRAFYIWRSGDETSIKTFRKAVIAFIIIGLFIYVPSKVVLYAPRGFDSWISRSTEGAYTGDDDMGMKQEDEQSSGAHKSDEGQDVNILTVEGRMVYFEGHSFENMEELGVYLDKVDEDRKIRLKDKFAISATFHQVEDLMKEKGIHYSFYDSVDGVEE